MKKKTDGMTDSVKVEDAYDKGWWISWEAGTGNGECFTGKFLEGFFDIGVIGGWHLKELESQLFSIAHSFFSCNFLCIFMFAFSSHKDSTQVAFVIQFLHFVQPLQAVLQTILIGAVVDHHDQIGVFAHAQGHWLVELMAAEIEEEEFCGDRSIVLGDYFGVDLGTLGLHSRHLTML